MTREEFLIKNPPVRWQVEFSPNDYPDWERKIIFRNINTDDGLDWIYKDIDRIFELYVEIGGDTSIGEAIDMFAYYAGSKFGMSKDETEILKYLIDGFDWTDIKYCIDILTDDVNKNVHDFLIKYNFKIYPAKY